MIEMTQINYIKYLREREGLSIAEIARRMQIHWITAKKYADGDVVIKTVYLTVLHIGNGMGLFESLN